jgi:hypothetical protein
LWGEQLALVGGLYLLGVWWIGKRFITDCAENGTYSVHKRGNHPSSSIFSSFSATSAEYVYLVLAGGGLFVMTIVANLWVSVVAARTLVFLTPFLMLVAGIGLARLEPRARAVFAGLLVLLALTGDQVIQPRLDYNVAAQAVAESYSPGDLVLLETGWDDNPFRYELSLALPDGTDIIRTLPWVDPGSIAPVVPQVADQVRAHRRVWIVQWLTPPQVIPWLASGEDGYVAVSDQLVPVGKQYANLYPAAPNVRIVLFERPEFAFSPLSYGGVLALHDTVIADHVAAGDNLHVDLWWSALTTPLKDYSVGVYLMAPDEDRVIAQHDGPPGQTPTSQWTPGEMIFDRHTLTVPDDLAPGMYRVAVSAYWFGDPQPLAVNDAAFAIVGQVKVD